MVVDVGVTEDVNFRCGLYRYGTLILVLKSRPTDVVLSDEYDTTTNANLEEPTFDILVHAPP